MDDYFNDLSITLINLPAHRFLCIKNDESQGYFDFWDKQDKIPGQDCDTISRLLDKVEGKLDGEDGVTGQYSGHVMARLYGEDGASSECYGVRLPMDHNKFSGGVNMHRVRGFIWSPLSESDECIHSDYLLNKPPVHTNAYHLQSFVLLKHRTYL